MSTAIRLVDPSQSGAIRTDRARDSMVCEQHVSRLERDWASASQAATFLARLSRLAILFRTAVFTVFCFHFISCFTFGDRNCRNRTL
jgi:hypothetical protein